MRPWLLWVFGVALVVAAWVVVELTPEPEIATAPFVVSAEISEAAVGRSFEATVTDVRLGERAAAGGWAADGTWLVVDLELTGRGADESTQLAGAVLVVNGLTFRASERPDSLFQTALTADIPRSGSIAFELPPDIAQWQADEKKGVVQLSADIETRLDSLIEVPIDLGALKSIAEVELLPTGWSER